MKNPLNGEDMSAEGAERVLQIVTVRRNARHAARSGNPAKRVPALRVLADVPGVLERVRRVDAARQQRRRAGAR